MTDQPPTNLDLDDIDVNALLTEVHRLNARIADLESGIAWRDAERERWADVHATVERAIRKSWSSIDPLDLAAELGPEPAVAPAPTDESGRAS